MRVWVLLIFLLTACGQSKTLAPVINKGVNAPTNAGVHTVNKGDTLWSIANRYKVPMRGVIEKNRLHAPYTLEIGQRLILPPPNMYKVKAGDSLYTISRTFGLDMSRISRLNNLRAPYTIHPGDQLRLPSTSQAQRGAYSSTSSKPNITSKKIAARTVTKKPTYRLPPKSSGRFSWPIRGPILSRYGPKKGGQHNDGINIKAKRGAPVKAADNGVVVYVGDQVQGYGNLVLVRHENRYMSAYAHLDKVQVKRGQKLSKEQVLGTVGSSGNVDTPQLHFEIRRGTKAVNPEKLL